MSNKIKPRITPIIAKQIAALDVPDEFALDFALGWRRWEADCGWWQHCPFRSEATQVRACWFELGHAARDYAEGETPTRDHVMRLRAALVEGE